MEKKDITLRVVLPNRQQNSMLEPRQGSFKSIFIILYLVDPMVLKHLYAISAVQISSDHYGSNTLSAFKALKKYARPLSPKISPFSINSELFEAQPILNSRRKLTLILRSLLPTQQKFCVGDLVQLCQTRSCKKVQVAITSQNSWNWQKCRIYYSFRKAGR